MDVDTAPPASSSGGGDAAPARSIKIHPLAIIGISDHHTRVVTGGSALPPSAPVVGLLFGYYSSDGSSGSGRDVSIVDAEEVVHPKTAVGGEGAADGDDQSHRAAILVKIELHQKVFPQHKVVGWYRVQKHDENSMNVEGGGGGGGVMPSEEDLRMNQAEMARYCKGDGGDDEVEISPLFVLMNFSKTDDGGDKKPSSSASSVNNASEEMEIDEELPLTVYETLVTPESSGGGAVFVNADFELETFEPERIAVEKVFKTQPSKAAAAASKDAASSAAAPGKEEGGDRKTGKKSKKDEVKQKPSKPSFTRGPTELDGHLDSLESSIRAMNVRMNVLLEFLQKVQQGEIAAPDDALLRSIDGLVRQMPLVLAALEEGEASSSAGGSRKPLRELENDYGNTMLLTYLAAVAKTARSVHVYSDKFQRACESGKGDPRRQIF